MHLRQAQEDYLQAEKAPLAPCRNLITLFMTTRQPATSACSHGWSLSESEHPSPGRDPGVGGGGARARRKSPTSAEHNCHFSAPSLSEINTERLSFYQIEISADSASEASGHFRFCRSSDTLKPPSRHGTPCGCSLLKNRGS